MAYSASDHQKFTVRMQKFMQNMNALRAEGKAIEEIYVNETGSGGDVDFIDTEIATKQEHIDGIVYIMAVEAFNENMAVATLDRTQQMTPFLHVS